ncbi:MAG: response regulator [Siphonobacter aquaeclarae]|nr:response regulator [Siphonobacter aquaeclarae]
MENKFRKVFVKRFAWLSLLVVLLAAFSFVAFLTDTKTKTIRSNLTDLSSVKADYAKLDSCIAILYLAENNSRLFLVTSDTTYRQKYVSQIHKVSELICAFQQQRESRQMGRLIEDKQAKNNQFIYLKKLTDSLMYLSVRMEVPKPPEPLILPYKISTTANTLRVDSVKLSLRKKNRKLFGRIIDAFNNSDRTETTLDKSSAEFTKNKADSIPATMRYQANMKAINNYYKKLLDSRKNLNQAETELLLLNDRIFKDLQETLRTLKAEENAEADAQRAELTSDALHDVTEFDELTTYIILIVVLLAVFIIYNIWKLYKNELALLRYSQQATQYAKMKGEFLANISHEIRTPLNSIIGFSEQINVEDLSAAQRPKVDAIRSSSDILMSLVNDILDFSKLESGKVVLTKEDIRPAALLSEVSNMLKIQADQRGIRLSEQVEIDPALLLAGDAFRIKQIVMNLLSNAIKFTPKGGQVQLKSSILSRSEKSAKWTIRVKDTGIGIAKENQRLIFEDFSQIESGKGAERPVGTGLGLSICKKIVDLYKGTIRVDSELGKGAEFIVELDLDLAQPASGTTTGATGTLREIEEILAGKKVIIADDNKMNRLLVSMILRKKAIPFTEAGDGEEALRLVKTGGYDLLISDIQMPKMGGVELAKQLRSTGMTLPILGFTAHVGAEERKTYLSSGMTDLLYKPFSEKEFRDVLDRILP